MKEPVTTTLDTKIIKYIKLIALHKGIRINEMLEEMISFYRNHPDNKNKFKNIGSL